MSQLAAQLNVLSGGFKTDARRLGSRPSFLFTAAQAADVDIDTVFALGVNGLTELRALDERFAAFEATLFSAARGAGHSSFDRNMQSKEVCSVVFIFTLYP
jgi:U3 small nucleolar RNA-associated protein 10